MRVVLAVLALIGCATDDGYRVELEAMPSTELAHGAEAVAIAAHELGVDPAAIGSVAWVIGQMRDELGQSVSGVAIGCDLWVAWWSDLNTSGASSDGPAISFTAMAHEVAHCALWLRGEDDPTHARVGWWGAGGRVERANAALVAAGL